jgi:hypothetical protein
MMEAAQLAIEATRWARRWNVEAAWCWLPNAQTTLDGVIAVGAYGNDGMGVRILLSADEAAATDPDALAQVKMVWLGKAFVKVRHDEVMGGIG